MTHRPERYDPERTVADPLYTELRERMVEEQIRPAVRDRRILEAMARVPRHRFVPPELRDAAYSDRPLPIGLGQTISQPLMVARMLAVAELRGQERVLEIGTGSGYQAALLGLLAGEVYTVEIVEELARRASKVLGELGASNVEVIIGNGRLGYEQAAPYDAVLVTAAADHVPEPLLSQLAEGGRLVIPVGGPGLQRLLRLTRRGNRFHTDRLEYCAFVPLVGRDRDDAARGRFWRSR